MINDLAARVQFLENENKGLKQQVETLSVKFEKSDRIKIQNDIKTIAETELSKSMEDKVKEFQSKLTQKLEYITETKIETMSINVEKDEINAKFEDYKMKIKSNMSSDMKLLDDKIDALHSDLQKANDEINQLKSANESKSNKIRNCEGTNKELKEQLQLIEETSIKELNDKLKLFKDDFLSEDKIQAAVINFMEHQSKSNELHPKSNETGVHIPSLDPDIPKHTKRNDKHTECDIVMLMDSRKDIFKETDYFQAKKKFTLYPAQR